MHARSAILAVLLVACSSHRPVAPASPPVAASPPVTSSPAAAELAALKVKVMAADYRGQLDVLATLREAAAQWKTDPAVGHLARYWSGFASWRIAMNGANHDMKPDVLKTNLEQAAAQFYAAIHQRSDFADAYAAAAAVNGWLATFTPDDVVATTERVSLASTLLARALELEPENPRVLWVKGGFLQFSPNGSMPAAIEVYRHMLEVAEKLKPTASSPLPDWGRPEALMSLAYAHLAQTPSDPEAALSEAQGALTIEPEWSYMRDVLVPQIEQKRASR